MKKAFAVPAALLLAASSLFAEGGETLEGFIIHHLSNLREWIPFPGFKIPLGPAISVKGIDMSPSLHLLMLLIASVVMIVVFGFLYRKKSGEAPHGITNLLEFVVVFIRDDISIAYLGKKDGRKFAPLFLTFFFFILILNLMGLVPLFPAATGNVNITAALSAITLILMIAGGFIKNGPLGFIKLFLPPGVPKGFYLLVFPIELLGLFTRPFALTMRLFANMMGGHVSIFSLIGIIMIFGWFGVPSIFLVLFIYAIELLVAFIQAYIFTMLSALFIGSMMHPSH
ncbi:MAG: F0F1 ATP synthase subunit A [Fibrobacterota bacterium]